MERKTVESSNLQSVGYDPDTQTLEVQFRHGAVYQYLNVPPNVHQELMTAPSHGSYFNNEIRGAFAYQEVR